MLLAITWYKIFIFLFLIVTLYIYAISILYKKKAGIIQYLIILLFPILGALGIVIGNIISKKTTDN